jgi:hypothetical protein
MMNLIVIIFIIVLSIQYINCEEVCDENGVCENTGVQIPKGANSEGKPKEVSKDRCEDRTNRCQQYSSQGECEKNPG